jgi:hypothetical protein
MDSVGYCRIITATEMRSTRDFSRRVFLQLSIFFQQPQTGLEKILSVTNAILDGSGKWRYFKIDNRPPNQFMLGYDAYTSAGNITD